MNEQPPIQQFQQPIDSRRPRSRRPVIVVTAAVALLLTGFGVVAYLLGAPERCFKPDSYAMLLALAENDANESVIADDLVPGEPLYSSDIYFTEGTSDIDLELSDDANDFFTALGGYYQARQTYAPIKITITTNYLDDTAAQLAQSRLDVVKRKLVDAGVSSSSIAVDAPIKQPVDEEAMMEDEAIDGAPVMVVVAPVSKCKE